MLEIAAKGDEVTPENGTTGAINSRLQFIEERHRELKTDYHGEFGNGGFKKDVQMALYNLQQKADLDEGYKRGVRETLQWQNKILALLAALVTAAIGLLLFFGVGNKSHALFSLTEPNSVVALQTGIRDTSR